MSLARCQTLLDAGHDQISQDAIALTVVVDVISPMLDGYPAYLQGLIK